MANSAEIMAGLKSIFENTKKQKRNTSILITGEWGAGKTYLWEKFGYDYLRYRYKTAYVSLFGKNNVDDVLTDLSCQANFVDEVIRSVEKGVGLVNFKEPSGLIGETIKLSSKSVVAMLSILKINKIEDTVICFDDLERANDELLSGSVFGLINDLYEHARCSVVVLCNKHKKNLSDKISEYGEKLFEYSFNLDSHDVDVLQVQLQQAGLSGNATVKQIFKDLKISSLRVQRKVLRKYSDVYRVLLEETGRVFGNVSEVVALLSYIYIKDGHDGLGSLSRRTADGERDITLKKAIEAFGANRSSFYVNMQGEFESLVWRWLNSAILDEESWRRLLRSLEKEDEWKNIQGEFRSLLDKFVFVFDVDQEQVVNELYELLTRYRSDAIKYCGEDNFFFIIDSVGYPGGVAGRQDLLEQCVYEYVCKLVLRSEHMSSYKKLKNSFASIFERFGGVESRLDQFAGESLKQLSNVELMNSMSNVVETRSWDEEFQIVVLSLSVEDIIVLIKEHNGMELIYEFVRWSSKMQDNPFSGFCEEFMMALDSLDQSGSADFKLKSKVLRRWINA